MTLCARSPSHARDQAVHDAVTQLRSYRRYFEQEVNRTAFAERVGFHVGRPKLALVIGRTIDFPSKKDLVRIVDDLAPVEVLSYDDLIIRYQRLSERKREAPS